MAEMGAVPLVLDRKARARAAIAGSAGNLIEWYDFYAYAYTALYFASAFFPSGDRTAQLLNVAAIYAAGFRSEEHPSELQSLMRTSYAVFCLNKKHQPTT